jgi:alpha-galactosidase
MNRSLWRAGRLAAALTSILCLSGKADDARPDKPAPAGKPNVIFILADDMGPGDPGCYGGKVIPTPNLDRLAAEGMRFTQHYAGGTVCGPSRSCLLTGQHTGRAFQRGNPGQAVNSSPLKALKDKVGRVSDFPLRAKPEDRVTIAEIFKAAGYRTGVFGKWGLGNPGSPGDPQAVGFDEFFGLATHIDAHTYHPSRLWDNGEWVVNEGERHVHPQYTARALDFIGRHNPSTSSGGANAPFFLYLAYMFPHGPYNARDSLQDEPFTKKHGLNGKAKVYAEQVAQMDRSIGRILAELKRLGIASNTLVIFASDNGYGGNHDVELFNSNGPFRDKKGALYEGGTRSPMIARWPGRIAKGTTSDFVSAFWDFMPTFAELTGQDIPRQTTGVSLLPALRGTSKKPRPDTAPIYFEWSRPDKAGQAIRVGDWKLIRWLSKPEPVLELFNLAEDESEASNVAEAHPERVTKLLGMIEEAHHPSVHFPMTRIDPGWDEERTKPRNKKKTKKNSPRRSVSSPPPDAREPANEPAKIKLGDSGIELFYNGKTIFRGSVSAVGAAGALELPVRKGQGDAPGIWVSTRKTVGARVEQRLRCVVKPDDSNVRVVLKGEAYTSEQGFPAETRGVAQKRFPLVRNAVGLSRNLRNNAIYDRKWDWVLEGAGESAARIIPLEQSDSACRFSFEVKGKDVSLAFRPRYYSRHRNLVHFDPWNYDVREDSITGWCSWWAYKKTFCQDDLEEVLKVWKDKRLGDYGYTFIQVDHSFHEGGEPRQHVSKGGYKGGRPTDWLDWNVSLFPDGMKGYTRRVREAGLEPAVWMGCFFSDAQVAKRKPDWFIQRKGKPFVGKFVNLAMDSTMPEVQNALIRPTFRGFKEAGFAYVKIDQLRHYLYDNLNHNPDDLKKRGTTSIDVYRTYLRTAREELGRDTYILACWGVMPEAIGLADGCRLGGDGFGPATLQQFNSWNGVVWRNDPDHCDVQPVRKPVGAGNVVKWADAEPTPEDAIIRPALTSIAGGMLMLCDKPETYENEANLRGVRCSSPVLFSVPGQLYDFDSSTSDSVQTMDRATGRSGRGPQPSDAKRNGVVCPWWLNEINKPFENWNVLHRFNWHVEVKTYATAGEVRFADLGLDASAEYLVYEFWSDKLVGTFKDAFPYGELKPYGLESFAIRKKLSRPQIVSTSRHLSQGGVELLDVRWDADSKTLSGKSAMVAEDACELALYVPNGYQVKAAAFEGTDTNVKMEGNLGRIGFRSAESKDVSWSVEFEMK